MSTSTVAWLLASRALEQGMKMKDLMTERPLTQTLENSEPRGIEAAGD